MSIFAREITWNEIDYSNCNMAKQTTSSLLNAKPFLKWAGGKGQLLSQLNELLPAGVYERDFTYIEPFVGGGAIEHHYVLI